jgi:tetratricopeptide (TPR) repeat protein
MSKARLTSTRHILPFGELSPSQFERLCFWLVAREGYLDLEYYGEAGADRGRDVIGHRLADDGGQELWVFQCKRYGRIRSGDLKAEVDKIRVIPSDCPGGSPEGIVFVTSATVSARTRDDVKRYCSSQGLQCKFWARAELDHLAKKYDDVLEEFFHISGTSRPRERSTAARPSVPHQLPAAPIDFTGRARERAELLEAIEHGGVTISGIRGLGGIGKTALALQVANELAPRFPDGQFYIDLKGVSERPLTPSEVQLHVIRSLDPAVDIPASPDQIAGLYRTMLGGKKALLLLDNARDGSQLEALIPPSPCVTIVTTRYHFAVPGLQPTNLGVLAADDARDLLLRLAPRIAEHADEIAELCGYLALALRAAGGQLASSPDLDPARYAERLRDERTRLELVRTDSIDVEASFCLSYVLLKQDAARVFRQLAVFPGSFSDSAEEEICCDSEHTHLSELVTKSLVEYEPSTGRYILHDLMRVFAANRLIEEERVAAERRFATHYKGHLIGATGLHLLKARIVGENIDELVGVMLLDLELPNIRAGHAWAEKRADYDDIAARLCVEYIMGEPLLISRLTQAEWKRWLQVALGAARNGGDRSGECTAQCMLASICLAQGEDGQALDLLRQSASLAKENRDRLSELEAIGTLGLAHLRLGEYRIAIEYFAQSLAIVRDVGDDLPPLRVARLFRPGPTQNLAPWRPESSLSDAWDVVHMSPAATIRMNLGSAYLGLGEYSIAIDYYSEALAEVRQADQRSGEATILSCLARTHYALREYQSSIQCCERVLSIQREGRDTVSEIDALNMLACNAKALCNSERAIELYQRSLDITRRIADSDRECAALANLGVMYYESRDYHTAINYHTLALEADRAVGNRSGECLDLMDLAKNYRSLGEYSKVIELSEQYVAISIERGDRQGAIVALGDIGDAYHSLKDYRCAVGSYERQRALAKETGDRAQERDALESIGRASHDSHDYSQAAEYLEESLIISEDLGDRDERVWALRTVALIHYALKRYARAIEFLERDVRICRKNESRYSEAGAMLLLGLSYEGLGDTRKAATYFEQAHLSSENKPAESHALWRLSLIEKSEGNRAAAIGHARAALRMKEEIGDAEAIELREKLKQWETTT